MGKIWLIWLDYPMVKTQIILHSIKINLCLGYTKRIQRKQLGIAYQSNSFFAIKTSYCRLEFYYGCLLIYKCNLRLNIHYKRQNTENCRILGYFDIWMLNQYLCHLTGFHCIGSNLDYKSLSLGLKCWSHYHKNQSWPWNIYSAHMKLEI